MSRQSTLVLTHDDVTKVVNVVGIDAFMRELIEHLRLAFESFSTSEFDVPVRTGFHYDEPDFGLIEWMPLHRRKKSVFLKTVGYHPSNPIARKLPTVVSTFNRLDPTTGELLAIADGALLTALRTGAASAVATKLLADLTQRVSVGLIGCGAQAVSQLHAIMQVADVADVRLLDINPDVMDSFAQRFAAFDVGNLRIDTCSLAEVLRQSDIICTATSIAAGDGPLFDNIELKANVHINAVGSDLPGKIELPVSLLRESLVCPDFPEQAMIEGECQQLSIDQIGPSIMQVAAQPVAFSAAKRRRTVFDSTGWALEDYVAMELLLRYARELKVGSQVELAGQEKDPWNPYEGIHVAVSAGAN